MPDHPLIRPAHSNDVTVIVELLAILFEQESEFAPNADRQRRALQALMRDPDRGVVLVAVDGARVVGSIMLLRTLSTAAGGRVCWMEDVIVRPDRRGRGVGAALVQAAIAEANRRGWTRISVLTDHDNTAALEMYAAAGFERSSMVLLRRHLPSR